MELSKSQLDWADDVMIDVVADSDNPHAERARMILVMLATTAFDLQSQLSAHQATQVKKPAITPPHLYPMCTCDLQSPYRGAQHGEDCPLWKGGE